MLTKLNYIAQSRRGKLMAYLNNRNNELSIEKQHQLYGGITELDNIIETLSEKRESRIETNTKQKEQIL
jgi:hypothetical protein